MMKNYERTCVKPNAKRKRSWLRVRIAVMLIMLCAALSSKSVLAASYSGDYRFWSQGGSSYPNMRSVGCLITAQAKMLYEANVNRSASFNPDTWYNWLLSNGGIASSSDLRMRDHNAPVNYAKSLGKNLSYLGYWKADDAQLWYNINAGYYTIVYVSGTNTGGSHFVLLDNALSKQKGVLYCYDSFSDRGSVSQQLLSRYSIHNGGHVYKGSNPVHSHNYFSRITKQPSCTQTGVKTYTCSCGSSYTETIKAKGHSYQSQTAAPTMTEKGYTLHTCSVCGYAYKDGYVDSPKSETDGWHYCSVLPNEVTADKYVIQYQNYYEKIQASSPGAEWTNAGVVKDEWKNSGSTYTSTTDLPTSNSRVLVHSVYYHFCGPKTGTEGNYDQTGNFVHYDDIPASSVTAKYLGTDNGHPYYFIYSKNGGGQVWCKSGVSCSGSYGTHGNRCRAWYKMNTYQNKVRNLQYKFTKTTDWIDQKDGSASSVRIRFKSLEAEKPDELEKPNESEKLDELEKPNESEKPDESENLDELEKPGESEKPDEPEKPDELEHLGGGEISNKTESPVQTDTGASSSSGTAPVSNMLKVGTKITVSNCQYKIISKKEAAFIGLKNKKQISVSIPAVIKVKGMTYKVTTVSSNAFYRNRQLKSVTIGKNVVTLGKGAFSGCSSLKKIMISSSCLKSVGKDAIKGIHKRAVIKCPKKKLTLYKKLFHSKAGYKKTIKLKG